MTCGHGNVADCRPERTIHLLDQLGLALEHEDVRPPDRADVQGLETRIQDENLVHGPNSTERAGHDTAAIARSTASRSSGERPTGRMAAIELLDVDPGVVAPLDRGQTRCPNGRIEEREGRRLLPADVLVGVEANDRRARERPVHPRVDPDEPCGDLVDRPVQIVDSRLKGNGEVDEIFPTRPEQNRLGTARSFAAHASRRERRPARPGRRRAHRRRSNRRRCPTSATRA